MARGTNLDRVKDLQAALKRAKPGDKLALAECAIIWGIGKGAFVNVRNRMADFPDPEPGPANSLLYEARPAIQAMLNYETRADAEERERQARAAAVMGMKGGRGRRKKDEIFLPPSELLKLSRLRAEIEQREREQALYVKRREVEDMLGDIFGIQSEHLGQLSLKADPNGLWDPEMRAAVDAAGRDVLLLIHGKISHMLPKDADRRPGRTKKSGSQGSGSGGAPARRQRTRRPSK